MRHQRHYFPRTPWQRTDADRLPATQPTLYRPEAANRYFRPRNRRHWKDAIRHAWNRFGGITGQPISVVRCRAAAMMKRDAYRVTDASKRTDAMALARRIERLIAIEPKPQAGRR